MATTIKSSKGEILVADSIFKSLDIETRRTINMLFKLIGTTKMVDIKLLNSQKQKVATTADYSQLLLQLHLQIA